MDVQRKHSPETEPKRTLSRRHLLEAVAAVSAAGIAAHATGVSAFQGEVADTASDPTPDIDELNIIAQSALPPPTDHDSNTYWQEIEKRVGCRLNFSFTPNSDYAAKVATVLASGDLPDFLPWGYDEPTIQQALDDGAFMSIQDLGLPEDTHGYPGLKTIPDFVWKNGAYNGKLYGLPTPGQRYQQASFLRQDWLDKLGLERPATTDDLLTILDAFAKKDPNGNGSNDTIGFSISNDRSLWRLFTEPFGVPNNWTVDEAGNLTSMDITPQMQAAIGYMRDVYATGCLNPDFPALNLADLKQEFTSGKSGGYNSNLASGYDLEGAQLRDVVPTAVVYPITPPKADGFKVVTWNRSGVNTVTMIHNKYGKDANLAWQALKVLDFWLDPATYDFVNFGFEGVDHTVQADGTLVQTKRGTADIEWIRAWGPRHYLEYVDAPYVTPEHRKQIKLDTARLAAFAVDDPTWGVYPDLGTDNPTADLDDFTTNTFERFIRGEQDLDGWDDFVAEWKDRGGKALSDALTKSYQAIHGS
jgi:putative aldouronate transport system substrate-binding protein